MYTFTGLGFTAALARHLFHEHFGVDTSPVAPVTAWAKKLHAGIVKDKFRVWGFRV